MDIYHWGKKLKGYDYYDWSYLKATDNCDNCDVEDNYVCHSCQIQELSGSGLIYDDDGEWMIKKEKENGKNRNRYWYMRIDVVDDNAVYINLNGYTYYIDDSTGEQIMKKYVEGN